MKEKSSVNTLGLFSVSTVLVKMLQISPMMTDLIIIDKVVQGKIFSKDMAMKN